MCCNEVTALTCICSVLHLADGEYEDPCISHVGRFCLNLIFDADFLDITCKIKVSWKLNRRYKMGELFMAAINIFHHAAHLIQDSINNIYW